MDAAGRPLDPYETLPPLPFDGAGEEAVREGTGAIRVYQDMICRVEAATAPKARAKNRQRKTSRGGKSDVIGSPAKRPACFKPI